MARIQDFLQLAFEKGTSATGKEEIGACCEPPAHFDGYVGASDVHCTKNEVFY